MEEKGKVFSMKGKPVHVKPTVYHMRLCLVGSPDMDIKNIQTFGIADDGFFMVKSFSNPRLPVFMTNPIRVKTVEIFKKGDKPITKLKTNKDEDEFFVDLMRKAHVTPPKTT